MGSASSKRKLEAVICKDDALAQLYREIDVDNDTFLSLKEIQVFIEELSAEHSTEDRYIFCFS
jgi:hypothetical protein